MSRVPAARSSVINREPWFSRVHSPVRARALVHLGQLSLGPACPCALPCPAFESFQIKVMVRTRGGSRLKPRVRFNTPEQEEQAPVPAPVLNPVPKVVPEEPQGFRRYQTRMGPRAPSPVPQRRSRRARPSKWAPYFRTGGVIIVQASAITVPVSSRGDLIASVIPSLED